MAKSARIWARSAGVESIFEACGRRASVNAIPWARLAQYWPRARCGGDLATNRRRGTAQVGRNRPPRAFLLQPDLDVDPVIERQPRPGLPPPRPDPARLRDPVIDRLTVETDSSSRRRHLLPRAPHPPHQLLAVELHTRRKPWIPIIINTPHHQVLHRRCGPAEVHFLGMSGTIPLGMALLIAAVGGGVLVAIAGVGRVTQYA